VTDYHIDVFCSDDDAGYIADIPDLDASRLSARLRKRPSPRSRRRTRRGSPQRARRVSRSRSLATGPAIYAQ
jgi:hypothetical protein